MDDALSSRLARFLDEQAEVVCSWLRGQSALGSDHAIVRPDLGVISFNRRQGEDCRPVVRIYPIAERLPTFGARHCADPARLKEITKAPRDATKVGHFFETRTKDPAWGGFLVLGRVADLSSNLDFGTLLALDEPDSEARNALDYLYFQPEELILSFPVAVLGSPVLTCFLALQGDGRIPDSLKIDLEQKLREPLAAFVTTNIVASLFVIAKELALGSLTPVPAVQDFLTLAAELFFAKRADLNSDPLFGPHEPLTGFADGAVLKVTLEDSKQSVQNWQAVLPSFQMPSSLAAPTDSSAGESVALVARSVEGLLSHIIEFMQDASNNRRKLEEQAGQATKARLFEAIQEDFAEGITELRNAMLRFNRAESKMESSGKPFLRLYREASLSLLFRKDSQCFYDDTCKKSGFVAVEDENRKKILYTIHEPENGGANYRTNGVYNAQEAWTAYKEAIEALGTMQDLEFFSHLSSAVDQTQAKLFLKALKQILHRTHTDELYPFSLIAHTALALDGHGSERPPIIVNGEELSLGCKAACFGCLLSNIKGDWLEEAPDGKNPLALFAGASGKPPVRASRFLAGWMQLIGSELLKLGRFRGEEVVCRSVLITIEDNGVALEAECENLLHYEAFDLQDAPETHGLRSCLRILSDAVGQANGPLLFRTAESGAMARAAAQTEFGWFGVGIERGVGTRFCLHMNRRLD